MVGRSGVDPQQPAHGRGGSSQSRDRAITYIKSLSLGMLEQRLVEAYVDAGPEMVVVLESRRACPPQHPRRTRLRPGSSPGGCLKMSRSRRGTANLERGDPVPDLRWSCRRRPRLHGNGGDRDRCSTRRRAGERRVRVGRGALSAVPARPDDTSGVHAHLDRRWPAHGNAPRGGAGHDARGVVDPGRTDARWCTCHGSGAHQRPAHPPALDHGESPWPPFTNEAANYNAFGAAFHVEDVSRFEYANLPCWLVFDRI